MIRLNCSREKESVWKDVLMRGGGRIKFCKNGVWKFIKRKKRKRQTIIWKEDELGCKWGKIYSEKK